MVMVGEHPNSTTERPQKAGGKRPIVYTGVGLAEVTGFSRTIIQAAKNVGFQFTHGTRTTEESWWAFLEANPHFRSRQGFQKKCLRRPDVSLRMRRQRASKGPVPRPSLADTRGGL